MGTPTKEFDLRLGGGSQDLLSFSGHFETLLCEQAFTHQIPSPYLLILSLVAVLRVRQVGNWMEFRCVRGENGGMPVARQVPSTPVLRRVAHSLCTLVWYLTSGVQVACVSKILFVPPFRFAPFLPRISAGSLVFRMDWKLEARDVPVKGRGVFPGVAIPANQLVLKFEGPIFTKETCPDFSEAIQGMQESGLLRPTVRTSTFLLAVDINAWMHSSGGLDDLVNHSCNPNLGLFPLNGDLYLLSLRDIAAGEELSFDYSTSMVDEPWSMDCCCGEKQCRGTIANFLDMKPEARAFYAERGVLPLHVLKAALDRNVELPAPSARVPGGSDSPFVAPAAPGTKKQLHEESFAASPLFQATAN